MKSSKKIDPYLNANQDTVDELYGKAMRWYQVAFYSYIGYLIFFVLLQPIMGLNLKKLTMQCLPLLIFLPGVIKKHHKTFSWICFVTLLYFTAYVVEVGSPLFHWSDVLGLSISVVLFIAAMMTSRWLQHWRYALFRSGENAPSESGSIENEMSSISKTETRPISEKNEIID